MTINYVESEYQCNPEDAPKRRVLPSKGGRDSIAEELKEMRSQRDAALPSSDSMRIMVRLH
jgi:hypothetical protein